MHLNSLLSRFAQCPRGESFYVCNASSFLGCCAQDPCLLDGCPRALVDVGGGSFVDPGEDEKERSAVDAASTAMTDSGVTHTVPNNDVVTVTKHTMIVTGRPSSTSDRIESTSIANLPTSSPTDSGPSVSSTELLPTPTASDDTTSNDTSSSLSMGTIIGIAVGGAVLLFMLLAAIFIVRRHSKASRRLRLESERRDSSARDDLVEDKHFPQALSAHTTGTQRYNDPFAPFGGRADEPEDPYRPLDNTFEMDGTSTAPIELPAVSVEPRSTTSVAGTQNDKARPKSVDVVKTIDPRANLETLGHQGGRPAYINHWNQYQDISGS